MLSNFFQDFDLFFFDLDGLLLDTEYLHYKGFISASKNFGYNFSFDFSFYLEQISQGRNILKSILCSSYPSLHSDWELLYRYKEELYISSLINNDVNFMPGAEILIKELLYLGKEIVIVTNSNKLMTTLIKEKVSLLQKIEKWVVREDYNLPKPYPDSYVRAKSLYVKEGAKVISFEDSIKGITSLLKAFLFGVLVSPYDVIRKRGEDIGIMTLRSLEEIFV